MYYLSSQGGFSSDQIKELGLPAEIENIWFLLAFYLYF